MRGVNAGRVATRPVTNGREPTAGSRHEDTLGTTAGAAIVRRLCLKRRRSRVPWIYAVYHARLGPGSAGAEPRRMAEPHVKPGRDQQPAASSQNPDAETLNLEP